MRELFVKENRIDTVPVKILNTSYVIKNPYEGDYTVIPSLEDQILPTRGRTFEDNITVKAVPICKTEIPDCGYSIDICKSDQETIQTYSDDNCSKVTLADTTLIDLTEDTIEPANTLAGYTGHRKDGSIFTGEFTFNKVYMGSEEPDNSLGSDGDLYIRVNYEA